MIEVYPHEAWCPSCHVSHPPGTKRCLHCGGGVLPMRPVQGMRGLQPSVARGPIEIATAPDIVAAPDEEASEAAARMPRPFRIGIATIWVVLAVVGAILRSCAERG
jgi:hypothetical protein